MFESVQKRGNGQAAMAVDIAPLIDVVFILLIFFLVTATFVRETGLEVDRPAAAAARPLETQSVRISIAESGAIYMDGGPVELGEVGERVRRFVAGRGGRGASGGGGAAVIVIPDEWVPAGRLVEVMDAAKLAGARDVAIATRPRRAVGDGR